MNRAEFEGYCITGIKTAFMSHLLFRYTQLHGLEARVTAKFKYRLYQEVEVSMRFTLPTR